MLLGQRRSHQTLRRYADQGKIPHYRNSAGQRLYDVDAYLRGWQLFTN